MAAATTETQRTPPGPAQQDRGVDQLIDLPIQFRQATVEPATYNEADNTVEVVWTTGARRRAYDWWTGTLYDEELVVSSGAVDMARFEAGTVQVLDGHRVYGGVSAILGVATRGWVKGGEGRATLKLSQRQEVAGIVGDIRAGIIRAISFGYSVERYEVTDAKARTDGGAVPLWRATRWTPQEISFVTVPADPEASTRSAAPQPAGDRQAEQADPAARRSAATHPCQVIRTAAPATAVPASPTPSTKERNTMDEPVQTATGAAAAPSTPPAPAAPAADEAVRAAAAAAAARAADITDLCARHGVVHLAAGLVRSGVDLATAQSKVLDELALRSAASGGHITTRVETVTDEVRTRQAGIENALLTRVDSRTKLDDNGRQYRGMSLLEIGREILERGGVSTRGMDKLTLATRMLNFRTGGMLTTSDFSSILSNVATKRLRMGYEENPGTYKRWARKAPNAPDFKSISITQLSAMPDLLQVNEHGEFKYGSLSDGAEAYNLITYGRIVSLSRQAIINDDLRAFDRLVTGFGGSAMRLENRLVYSILTANAALADTVALFHSTHANLGTGAGSALQLSSLATARTAMRVQKGLQSEELNIAPSFLIAPAALEQTAYQLTSANYVPATTSAINEFRAGGRTALEPVIEPVLDGSSATAWYLAASNSQVDTVEFCYLDGAEGPVIESELGFDVDGVSFKCREDFAAKAIDFRGLYKANGA
jgi:phage major head subunit gpT-like protein